MLIADYTPITITITKPCTLQNATGISITEYKLQWLLMKWEVGRVYYKEYVEINLN